MLQNSVVISLVMTVLKKFDEWYEYSLFHKVCSVMGKGITIGLSGSVIGNLGTRETPLEDNSLTYRILLGFLNGIHGFCKWVNKVIFPKVEESYIYSYVKNFETLEQSLLSAGITLTVSGFGIAILGIFFKKISLTFGLVVFTLGFLALLFSGGVKKYIVPLTFDTTDKMVYESIFNR